MRCYHCNTELPEGSRFCSVCGTALAPAAEAPKPEEYGLNQVLSEITPEDTSAFEPETAAQQPVYARQPVYAPQPEAAPAEPAQKKSKKGLLIGLLSGAAVLVIGAILAVVLLFGQDPLTRAFIGTRNALGEMTEGGNLGELSRTIDRLAESKRLSAEGSLSMRMDILYTGSYTMTYDAGLNLDGSVLDGTLRLGQQSDYGSTEGNFRFAMNDKELQVSMDGLDGLYGVTVEEFMELMGLTEGEGSGMNWRSLSEISPKDLLNGPMKEVFERVAVSESGRISIETDGGEKVCDHYVLTWDAALVKRYAENENAAASGTTGSVGLASWGLVSLMNGLKPNVDFYVEGGRILGVDLHDKEGGTTYFLRFLGAKNPWEHLRLNTNNGVGIVELFWVKNDSISMNIRSGGQELEIFRYNDSTGYYWLCADEITGAGKMDGYLRAENGEAEMSMNFTGSGMEMRVCLTVKPLQTKPAMLGSSYTDYAKMTEAERQALLERVNEVLFGQ